MDWQYIAVFIILVAVVVWTLVRIFSRKKPGGNCCGCSLSDCCDRKQKEKKKPMH